MKNCRCRGCDFEAYQNGYCKQHINMLIGLEEIRLERLEIDPKLKDLDILSSIYGENNKTLSVESVD